MRRTSSDISLAIACDSRIEAKKTNSEKKSIRPRINSLL